VSMQKVTSSYNSCSAPFRQHLQGWFGAKHHNLCGAWVRLRLAFCPLLCPAGSGGGGTAGKTRGAGGDFSFQRQVSAQALLT
jgi:hypothetical protein